MLITVCLSLLDIPSSLWLDTAIHQVLQEHSYASLPLSKRRKAASYLPPFDHTPLNRPLLSKCIHYTNIILLL